MVKVTVYKNSFLASAISIMGYGVIALGAVALVNGDIPQGIASLLAGICLMAVAGQISSNKAFRTWWKQVEKQGLIPEIQKSAETAVEVYRKNPDKRTLKKIRSLNPPAAAYIEGGCKGPVPQMIIQEPAQQPTQKTVSQPPVWQPVQQQTQSIYPSPVYQTPAAVQTTGPQADCRLFRDDCNSIDEYVDDVQRVFDANTQNDPEVYWQCAKRLETKKSSFPDNEHLLRLLALSINHYSVYFKPNTFEDRKQIYYALKQILEMNPQSFSCCLDALKFNLFYHVVIAAILAVNANDIQTMEEVWQWLHTASKYRMLNIDDRARQYQDVALPSIRLFMGHRLAKAYLAQGSENKKKACIILEDALQTCSFAQIRQCDLNPDRNTDLESVLYRDEVQELWRSTVG